LSNVLQVEVLRAESERMAAKAQVHVESRNLQWLWPRHP
jgi:hypothetical protein